MEDVSKEVLLQVVEGNRIAFEKLYRAASGFVYSLALRITNNREDAQEVAQDVFIKIYKNLKWFKFRCAFKTWVYRITVNTAINAYRKISKERRHILNGEETVENQPACGINDFIQQHDNGKLVESLLAKLNPDQRACIVLREINGLNYKEIAQALQININTVRSRLKRARETLMALGKGGEAR